MKILLNNQFEIILQEIFIIDINKSHTINLKPAI